MTRMPLAGLAAAALLALTLAGCTTTDSGSTDTGSSTDDSSDTSTDTSTDSGTDAGSFVTLPGSGDYTVGVTAPIGGYSLKGDPAEQPDGCTWALEDADGNTQFTDQGTTIFITEENKFFQTSGCPDWVQFQ